MANNQNNSDLTFNATLQDNVSPQVDQIVNRLQKLGATKSEIKLYIRAYDEASGKAKAVKEQLNNLPKEHRIRIHADANEALRTIDKLRNLKPVQMVVRVKDETEATTQAIHARFQKLKWDLESMFKDSPVMHMATGYVPNMVRTGVNMAGGAVGLGGLGSIAGAGALVKQSIDVNSSRQQDLVSLEALLKDQSKAQAEMRGLIAFAKKTPFSYQDVLGGDVLERSLHLNPKGPVGLKTAGNLASAFKSQGVTMNDAVLALSEGLGGDYRRLKYMGIPIGASDFQVGGKFAGQNPQEAIGKYINARFGNAQEMQSKTFAGAMSNVKDFTENNVLASPGMQTAFGLAQQGATAAYQKTTEPDTIRKVGEATDKAGQGIARLYTQVQKGEAFFRTNLEAPLQRFVQTVVNVGTVFTKTFGSTAASGVKTLAEAFSAIVGPIAHIVQANPVLIQMFALMQAFKFLKLDGLAAPFEKFFQSINPLTFSLKGLLGSMIDFIKIGPRLAVVFTAKSILDMKNATDSLGDSFKSVGQEGSTALNKLQVKLDAISGSAGKSASQMKELAAVAAKLAPGSVGPQQRANFAFGYAQQSALLDQKGYGKEAQVMLMNTVKGWGGEASKYTEDRVEKATTQVMQAVTATADALNVDLKTAVTDTANAMTLFGKEIKMMHGPENFRASTAAQVYGILQKTPMSNAQLNTYQSPLGLSRAVLGMMARPDGSFNEEYKRRTGKDLDIKSLLTFKPGLQTINQGIGRGSAISSLFADMGDEERRARNYRNLNKDLTKDIANNKFNLSLPPIQSQMDKFNAGIQGNINTPQGVFNEANRLGAKAPVVDQAIQDNKAKQSELNLVLQQYEQIQGAVNEKAATFQYNLSLIQRGIEDASLATQEYSLNALYPLQRQMGALQNAMAVYNQNVLVPIQRKQEDWNMTMTRTNYKVADVAFTLGKAQYDMRKWTGGLMEGEQSLIDQSHALDLYLTKLDLLKTQNQGMQADLTQTTFTEGYTSVVKPLMGLSLDRQIQMAERRKRMVDDTKALTTDEQHYQLTKSQRGLFERTERSFGEAMKMVKLLVPIMDQAMLSNRALETTQYKQSLTSRKLNEEMYKGQVGLRPYQDAQYGLGQEMYAVNRKLEEQQHAIALQQLEYQKAARGARVFEDAQKNLRVETYKLNRELFSVTQEGNQLDSLSSTVKEEAKKLTEIYTNSIGGQSIEQRKKAIEALFKAGILTEDQRKALEEALKDPGTVVIDKYVSAWKKAFSEIKSLFFGMFTGQTWVRLGDMIKQGFQSIFGNSGAAGTAGTALGITGGVMAAGYAANAMRLGVMRGIVGPTLGHLPGRIGGWARGQVEFGSPIRTISHPLAVPRGKMMELGIGGLVGSMFGQPLVGAALGTMLIGPIMERYTSSIVGNIARAAGIPVGKPGRIAGWMEGRLGAAGVDDLHRGEKAFKEAMQEWIKNPSKGPKPTIGGVFQEEGIGRKATTFAKFRRYGIGEDPQTLEQALKPVGEWWNKVHTYTSELGKSVKNSAEMADVQKTASKLSAEAGLKFTSLFTKLTEYFPKAALTIAQAIESISAWVLKILKVAPEAAATGKTAATAAAGGLAATGLGAAALAMLRKNPLRGAKVAEEVAPKVAGIADEVAKAGKVAEEALPRLGKFGTLLTKTFGTKFNAFLLPIVAALDFLDAKNGKGDTKERGKRGLIGMGAGAAVGGILGTFVFPGVGTGVGALIGAGIGEMVGTFWKEIKQGLKWLTKKLVQFLPGVFFGPIGLMISALLAFGKDVPRKVGHFIGAAIHDTLKWLVHAAIDAGKGLIGAGLAVIQAVTKFMADFKRHPGKAMSEVFNAVWTAAKDGFTWLKDQVISAFGDFFKGVGDFLSGLVGGLDLGDIVGLAGGKDNVPYDGYKAELHAGEAVLQVGEAEAWRRYKSGNTKGSSNIRQVAGLVGSNMPALGTATKGLLASGSNNDILMSAKKTHKELEKEHDTYNDKVLKSAREYGSALAKDEKKATDKSKARAKAKAAANEKSVEKQAKDTHTNFKKSADAVKTYTSGMGSDIKGLSGKVKGLSSSLKGLGGIGDGGGFDRKHPLDALRLQGIDGRVASRNNRAINAAVNALTPDEVHDKLNQIAKAARQDRTSVTPEVKHLQDLLLARQRAQKQEEDTTEDFRREATRRTRTYQGSVLVEQTKSQEERRKSIVAYLTQVKAEHIKNHTDLTDAEQTLWDKLGLKNEKGTAAIQKVVDKYFKHTKRSVRSIISLISDGGDNSAASGVADAAQNNASGGIRGRAFGGVVDGKNIGRGHIVRVGEEGYPEAIIPLAPHRRDRALRLMDQTRGYLGLNKATHEDIPRFAYGGMTYAGMQQANRLNRANSSGPHGSGSGMIPVANFMRSKFNLDLTTGRDHKYKTDSGNVSDHVYGRAGDFNDPRGDGAEARTGEAAWKWWTTKGKDLVKQVIFKGRYMSHGTGIINDPGIGHYDHVHLAIMDGFAFNKKKSAKALERLSKGLDIAQLLRSIGDTSSSSAPMPELPGVPKGLKKGHGELGRKLYAALTKGRKVWKQSLDSATPSDSSGGGWGGPISKESPDPGKDDILTTKQMKRLIDSALAIEHITHKKALWEKMLLRQAERESSFQVHNTNNWDSNAAAGDPSKGLFQTIGATFKSYARPGYDKNIYDPLSNTLAAIRYMIARYGKGKGTARKDSAVEAMWARGGGAYAAGGIAGFAGGGFPRDPIPRGLHPFHGSAIATVFGSEGGFTDSEDSKDPLTASGVGYRSGYNLRNVKWAFGEIVGRKLGHLPLGYKYKVTHGKKSAVLGKYDVNEYDPGDGRRMDIWIHAAKYLDHFEKVGMGKVKIDLVNQNAPLGPTDGSDETTTAAKKKKKTPAEWNPWHAWSRYKTNKLPGPAAVLAGGMDRVPVDGYRALLHKDEAVLPSHDAHLYREAKKMAAGGILNSDGSTHESVAGIARSDMFLKTQITDFNALGARVVEKTRRDLLRDARRDAAAVRKQLHKKHLSSSRRKSLKERLAGDLAVPRAVEKLSDFNATDVLSRKRVARADSLAHPKDEGKAAWNRLLGQVWNRINKKAASGLDILSPSMEKKVRVGIDNTRLATQFSDTMFNKYGVLKGSLGRLPQNTIPKSGVMANWTDNALGQVLKLPKTSAPKKASSSSSRDIRGTASSIRSVNLGKGTDKTATEIKKTTRAVQTTSASIIKAVKATASKAKASSSSKSSEAKTVKAVKANAKTISKAVKANAKSVAKAVKSGAKSVDKAVKSNAKTVVKSVKSLAKDIKAVSKAVKSGAKTVASAVKKVSTAVNKATTAIKKVSTAVNKVITAVKKVSTAVGKVSTATNKTTSAVKQVTTAVKNNTTKVVQAIKNSASKSSTASLLEAVKKTTTAVGKYGKSMLAQLQGIALVSLAVYKGFKSLHPKNFASGLYRVPGDNFLANLHQDEMVLTKAQADAYRNNRGSSSMNTQRMESLLMDIAGSLKDQKDPQITIVNQAQGAQLQSRVQRLPSRTR